MIEMLSYGFMQKAFIAGLFIALSMACIGMVSVLRRHSMIGDALSHASLAGVALGLVLGISPVTMAIVVAIGAAFSIEVFHHFFPQASELSIAIVMSAGIGLAGVLSGFVTAANFNSYLFGSIVSIPDNELWLVVICSLVVVILSALFYKELFYIGVDPQAAAVNGVPVRLINILFTILTAVAIAIAARTVGTLVVASQLVLPVASAMQHAKSYRGTYIASVLYSVGYTLCGIAFSYGLNLKPGGTIVMTSLIGLILLLIGHTIYKYVSTKKRGKSAHRP